MAYIVAGESVAVGQAQARNGTALPIQHLDRQEAFPGLYVDDQALTL